MSQVAYLLDENVPRALAAALRRREPAMDVRRVGQSGMPTIGSSDPELLSYCEQAQRILVSRDRATLPMHIADHIAAGGHTTGVLLATHRCTLANMAEDLILIWIATDSSEWTDVAEYLPLTS